MEPRKGSLQDRADTEPGVTTALIVGAGAVVNSWAPVLRAIREPHMPELTESGGNSKLAQFVFLMRMYETRVSEEYAKDRQKMRDILTQIRRGICLEITGAEESGELRVRPEFGAIVERFVIEPSSRVLFVNTDWDRVVDAALAERMARDNKPPPWILHVHGDASSPDALYLPSEVTHEPYRSEASMIELSDRQWQLMNGLAFCDRAVLYGLSLSPLDAELCSALWVGLGSDRLKEVVVIALAKDLDQIAERVNFILQRNGVQVCGFTPDNLDSATDYTLRSD